MAEEKKYVYQIKVYGVRMGIFDQGYPGVEYSSSVYKTQTAALKAASAFCACLKKQKVLARQQVTVLPLEVVE